MFGLKILYLKWIIMFVLLFGLINITNNKLLGNSEEKSQPDSFENQKKEEFSVLVDKLSGIADKLTKISDNLINKKNKKENYDDSDDESDDETEDEPVQTPVKKKQKKKTEYKKKNIKVDKKPLVDQFSNYTKGVSSSFGGDYLLLDN